MSGFRRFNEGVSPSARLVRRPRESSAPGRFGRGKLWGNMAPGRGKRSDSVDVRVEPMFPGLEADLRSVPKARKE